MSLRAGHTADSKSLSGTVVAVVLGRSKEIARHIKRPSKVPTLQLAVKQQGPGPSRPAHIPVPLFMLPGPEALGCQAEVQACLAFLRSPFSKV